MRHINCAGQAAVRRLLRDDERDGRNILILHSVCIEVSQWASLIPPPSNHAKILSLMVWLHAWPRNDWPALSAAAASAPALHGATLTAPRRWLCRSLTAPWRLSLP
jgi:hypothetical protein